MSGEPVSKIKFEKKSAIVIGGEGKGMRRLTKENCDFLVSIPIEEKISSLNAAMSAAIIFYEISHQKKSN